MKLRTVIALVYGLCGLFYVNVLERSVNPVQNKRFVMLHGLGVKKH